jgi:hypothetical protein
MTALPCCNPVAGDEVRAGRRGPRLRRRWFCLTEWTFPSAILLLLPKCPLCIAAYVAVVTGVGISAATAALLKEVLVIVCATSLAYLVLRSCDVRGWLNSQ